MINKIDSTYIHCRTPPMENRPATLKAYMTLYLFTCLKTSIISQRTQNNCITFVQRRPNVFDVGPTLYKCYTNVFVFAGVIFFYKFRVTSFQYISVLT